MEKGIIPPHALFEELNPDIDAEFYNITVCACATYFLAQVSSKR